MRVPYVKVLVACALTWGAFGCSGPPADPARGAGGHGGGAGGDGGGPGKDPAFDQAFRPAARWSAPDRSFGLDFTTSQGDLLVDMNGDGRPDLVIVGDDRALFDGPEGPCIHVHRNTGSGFGAAEAWTLPPGIDSFVRYPLDADVRSWRLADMDGDGRPDLLVTSEGKGRDATPTLGGAADPHWLHFRNTGKGFEQEGRKLPLPPEMLPYVATLERPLQNGTLALLRLVDLDGDGILDYVATWDEAAGSVPEGRAGAHWLLFRGDGSSFDAGVAWPVPEGGSLSGGFFDLDWDWRDGSVGPGNQSWMLRDLDGDGRPDLLVFAERVAGEGWVLPGLPGERSWILHPNTGSGFGAPRKIRLPAQVDVSALSNVWDGNRAASLLDMDGDGRLDLVVPEDTFGRSHWSVFRQGDDGFSDTPEVWAIPPDPDRPDDSFPWAAGMAIRGCAFSARPSCEPGGQQWVTLDLDGDGRADLVEWDFTALRNLPGAPEAPHFRVYLNRYGE